jgi:fructokinase
MIAVAGEALIDAHLAEGVLRPFAGGGPFNTAIALARLDVPVCFVGGVSTDQFGRLLNETLADNGVDRRYVKRVAAPTPLAVVDTSAGDAAYSFYLRDTAYQAFEEVDVLQLSSEVAALHVGTLALATDPPASALEALASRVADSMVIMVDPNVRPAIIGTRQPFVDRFERWVRLADVVKLSAADLAWLYDDARPEDVAGHFLALGAALVVVTDGADGASAWTNEWSARTTAPAVTVADTVGAGDAFGAALLAWLWRAGRLDKRALREIEAGSLEAAIAFAAAVASLQCTRPSASAPTSADVDRFLEQQALVVKAHD